MMKSLIALTTCIFILIGCHTTSPVGNQTRNTSDLGYVLEDASNSTSNNYQTKVDNALVSLSQHLRRVPGVRVTGDDTNGSVKLQGSSSSLVGTQEPLFVVDGVRWGTSLPDVARRLNVNDIDNITVLRGASETSIYGSQGANGVIVIRTKKD